jgi:regulator of protease activity HflC (stomatin/prohibitin superfamily)
MTGKMKLAMAFKFEENGLTLVDFIVRNITFSPEYSASVEQKQIAEQQALQAGLVVEQRRQEAFQAIEQAKGQAESVKIRAQGDADGRLILANAEAKALELIAAALAGNKDLLTYQYILKLAPGIQVMLVPNNAPFLLPLPSLTATPAPTTAP